MTYLFSENRELKNIQDGDVVVWDCGSRLVFEASMRSVSYIRKLNLSFVSDFSMYGEIIHTAHFTRIHTEPQTAPDIPVPCRSN